MIFNRYILLYFLRIILLTFLGVCLIILFADLLEQIRRHANKPGISMDFIISYSIMRIPFIIEETITFVILIGSMIGLLNLSRRQELIVARSVGLSVWQFLKTPLLVAFGLGVISTIALNPIAALLDTQAREMRANALGQSYGLSSDQTSVWLRQVAGNEAAIIRAGHSSSFGQRLSEVTILVFNNDFHLINTLEAKEAHLKQGYWLLEDVLERPSDKPKTQHKEYQLETPLTPTHVENALQIPGALSFWSIPKQLEIARSAGLPISRYEVKFHKLLALPFLFCAAVFIASTVSLRNFRFGGIGMQIFYGILGGFSLFVVGKMGNDLGNAGIVNAVLAAWFTPIAVIVLCLTILLFTEDG